MTPSAIRVVASHVVSDVFEDGEAAVIDLRSGAYFSLNPTGALLWPLVVAGTTVAALVDLARRRTDGGPQVAGAVEAFVAALLAEDLVEEAPDVTDGAGSDAPDGDGPPIPFVAPELQRFDDLQELLLLDPIHDVSDRGWPHTA